MAHTHGKRNHPSNHSINQHSAFCKHMHSMQHASAQHAHTHITVISIILHTHQITIITQVATHTWPASSQSAINQPKFSFKATSISTHHHIIWAPIHTALGSIQASNARQLLNKLSFFHQHNATIQASQLNPMGISGITAFSSTKNHPPIWPTFGQASTT